MASNIKTSNTQNLQAITKYLAGKNNVGRISNYQLARAARKLAENSAAIPVQLAKVAGNTATTIAATVAGRKVTEGASNAAIAKEQIRNNSDAVTKALQQWNNTINLNPDNAYVKGAEGSTSDSNTTGSVLGGY